MASSSQIHKIGVATATIIGMNAMIGAGIFTAPAAMASNVGPAGIIAYILVVIAVWFMAQSLARLAYLFPQEGSFYTYAKQWGGHTAGLIASGAYFVGLLVAMGLLSRVAGFFLADFFPSISPTILGLIALWGLVILNMCGMALSELGQHILIVCTVLPLLVTTVICFFHADMHNLVPFMPYGIGNVFKATRIVIFGFFGFESAASLFAIVKNPERNVPKALTYSIIAVGIIYTLFIASIIISTPSSVFSGPATKVTDILRAILPGHSWLITGINISILSAIVGTIHSMIWGSSALLITLMKKVKITDALIKKNIINHKVAVFLVGLCIFISYITLTNIDLFFCITALCIISAFILSMITLLTIKSEWRSGQNIKTLLGIATALMIFYFAAEGLWQELVTSSIPQKIQEPAACVRLPEETIS
ncbi:MAG: APC family permease [Candidatus Dependentiae bacterium]|nr:APC family permease [Candidatus Dependentiae bacterium]